MDRNNIVSLFSRLAELEPEECLRLRFLCDRAADHVELHTKEGADLSGYAGGMEYAAACLAYYRYILWSVSCGGKIKIGEVTIEAGGRSSPEAAEKLCRSAFYDISGIMDNDDFLFEAV